MRFCDFICDDCEHKWIYEKAAPHHKFPQRGVECPNCKSKNTRRVWSGQKIHTFVREGKMGNAKNGYTSKENYANKASEAIKKLK